MSYVKYAFGAYAVCECLDQSPYALNLLALFAVPHRIIGYYRICKCIANAFNRLCSFAGLSGSLLFTSSDDMFEWLIFGTLYPYQGPVVQSIDSLTSLLVVKMLTVLVSTISASHVFYFCWKNMSSFCKCKSYSHFCSKNISIYAIFNDQSYFWTSGPSFLFLYFFMHLFHKMLGGIANSVDPDQTARTVWSGYLLFAYDILSENLLYKILGQFSYYILCYFQAKNLFSLPLEVIMKLDSSIVQLDKAEDKLLVSTLTRCYLCDTNRSVHTVD